MAALLSNEVSIILVRFLFVALFNREVSSSSRTFTKTLNVRPRRTTKIFTEGSEKKSRRLLFKDFSVMARKFLQETVQEFQVCCFWDLRSVFSLSLCLDEPSKALKEENFLIERLALKTDALASSLPLPSFNGLTFLIIKLS